MSDAPSSLLRLAHRGDWRQAPENSLAAIVAGAGAGRSDGVEFDVRLAADGTPVVIHDPTLWRVQGIDARVDELGYPALGAHGVPTLTEVLAALPSRMFLDVELKVTPNVAVGSVLEAARGAAPRAAVVSSFEPDALRTVAATLPGWPRWLNVEHVLITGRVAPADAVPVALELGCRGIAAHWRLISPRFAERVLAAGLSLAAFTVRREPTLRRLERLGVRAACVEGRALDGEPRPSRVAG